MTSLINEKNSHTDNARVDNVRSINRYSDLSANCGYDVTAHALAQKLTCHYKCYHVQIIFYQFPTVGGCQDLLLTMNVFLLSNILLLNLVSSCQLKERTMYENSLCNVSFHLTY